MSAALQLAQFQMIALEKLEESVLNPRRVFDKEKQAELNASVKSKGVLEPLLVRPSGKGWEVVAGARRLRAAVANELKEVPCLVRALDDAEVIEIAVVENAQRHDMNALEEGDAYKRLIQEHGRTVEQLVEKTGRSRTIVFARMKLAELQGEPRRLVVEGKLSASVAELLARLPTREMQEAALEKLQKNIHYRHANPDDKEDLSRFPLRDAKALLDEDFRLVIKKAPFDATAVDLVKGAGACGGCPKRTGAEKELFPGVKEDTCLDAACWRAKASAATRLLKEEIKEHGKELVRINRLTDQYDSSRLASPVAEKFSRPSEKIDGKNTWKDLLGGLDGAAVIALDKDNKTHNLVDKKKALELLKAKDPKKAAVVEKALEEPKKEDWEARNAEAQKERAAENAVLLVVKKKALDQVKKLDVALQLMLVSWAAEPWEWDRVLENAGLPAKTKPEKLKPAEIVRLFIAKAFMSNHGRSGDILTLAAKLTKVDAKALRKQAREAEAGKCFACGCTKEKQCRKDGKFCVDGWVDHPEATLCNVCKGEG